MGITIKPKWLSAYEPLPTYKRDVIPKNILSLDSEWDKDGNRYVWCVYGHTYYDKGENRAQLKEVIEKTFYSMEECVSFLFRQTWENTFLCGMSLLDDLIPMQREGGFDWDILFSNTQFIGAFDPKNRKGMSILDIFNFFPKSLYKLGQEICPGVYDNVHEIEKVGKDRMVKACMSHAKTGVLVMCDIQDKLNEMGSNLKITPALTAQELHRRVFLDKSCGIYGNNLVGKLEKQEKLFHFQAYFGGRTENFISDATVINVAGIDVNSMYPEVMSKEQYPDMMTYKEINNITLDHLKTYMSYYEGLAAVTIELKRDILDIPLLHKVVDGKLKFPIGFWSGVYTFPELRRALELGYKILSIEKVGYCKPTKKPFFKDYVDALYPLKLIRVYKPFAKLMLNSLYGKFGQKANEDSGWVLCNKSEIKSGVLEAIDIDVVSEDELNNSDETYCFTHKNGLTFKYVKPTDVVERGFTNRSFPLIAAYVTGYARIKLHSTLLLLGIDNVYYCDTDSIYCDQNKLIEIYLAGKIDLHPTNLGAWDIEHWDCELTVRGLKYYRLLDYVDSSDTKGKHNQYTIRGVPHSKQQEYWDNKYTTLIRRVKYATHIKTGKQFGSSYETFKTDRAPQHKRTFISPLKSVPVEIGV